MLHESNLSTQHQLINSDASFSPIKEHACDRQNPEFVASKGSMEANLLSETESDIFELDLDFSLNPTDSFGSVYKGNAYSDDLFRPSNKVATQDNINGSLPIDEITVISCDDALRSIKTSVNFFPLEECQEKAWMQSDVEKDNCLISDVCSSDVQITNCAVIEDLVKKPITATVSENELQELDLDGCLSVSDTSDLGCCASVFEESDSDYENSSDFSFQSSSSGNKSIPNESMRGIIPTAVHSLKNCDNRMSFSTLDSSSHVRPYQEASWLNHYKQLRHFHEEKGHCCVPNSHPKYQKLINWIKRQRRDYKQMKNGRKSGMSIERKHMLESIDFIWDVHDAVWRERLEALKAFRRKHGNCNVPYRSSKEKQLGTWVKAQRHQYKLYREGKPSSMNPHRIFLLNKLDFQWVGRSSTSKHIIKQAD